MIRASAFAIVLASGWSLTALAQDGTQQPCAPRELAARMLTEVHGEELLGQGLAESGAYLVELFVNPSTGAWTVIATMPNGMACMLEAGQSWSTPAKKAKKGRPA